MHGRNLDFNDPNNLRKIGYNAVFVRDGKYSFDATMFAGFVGVYTGTKKNAFSISLNQRAFQKDADGRLENIFMMYSGYRQASIAIRETLDTCKDYACAYRDLRTRYDINAIAYNSGWAEGIEGSSLETCFPQLTSTSLTQPMTSGI